MPSIGHVAVGLAAAHGASLTTRQRVLLSLLFSAAALLPDLDVVGFAFGVRYGAPWGHRGASHSLFFALVLALAATPVSARLAIAPLRLFAWLLLVFASHGLLDALTDGGRGIALLWPFTNERFFAPLRPIPVAPIGVRFFSARGLHVALAELLLFAPFFVYGLWPRARRAR